MSRHDAIMQETKTSQRGLFGRLRALLRDRSGNFGLTFALLTVPVMTAIGCSFDYVQALNTHRKMQSDLDAAIVAAVQHVGARDDAAIKAEIGKWMDAQAEQKGYYVLNTAGIVIDSSNSTIKASVSATVPTTFLKIVGINSVPVAVQAAVLGGKNSTAKTAFSMYLVLDRSGSMSGQTNTSYTTTCYRNETAKTGAYTCTKVYTKMEALKLAANNLLDQFTTADPEKKYVRTAAVSYDDVMDTPAGLAWGEDHVSTYVNNLSPRNYTDSSKAMQTALAALIATSNASKDENKIHKAMNGVATPKKYIVFMTDGENTKLQNGRVVENPAADTSTKATCDSARTNNVTVFTIAFMAPTNGQNLLKYCATSAENYFPAENTAQLVEAFKIIGATSSKSLVRLTQ